jgi:hypothetical protein
MTALRIVVHGSSRHLWWTQFGRGLARRSNSVLQASALTRTSLEVDRRRPLLRETQPGQHHDFG